MYLAKCFFFTCLFGTELLIDFEEVNGDEELMTIYPCPFCEEDFDLLELCFHIDLDHPIEAESGVFYLSHTLITFLLLLTF